MLYKKRREKITSDARLLTVITWHTGAFCSTYLRYLIYLQTPSLELEICQAVLFKPGNIFDWDEGHKTVFLLLAESHENQHGWLFYGDIKSEIRLKLLLHLVL